MTTIAFDDIEGALGDGPKERLRLEMTRQAGHYILIVSRKKPDGQEQTIVHFRLAHSDVQRIADLAET